MTSHWFQQPCPTIDPAMTDSAQQRQLNLTKPAGSLGRLEDLAVSFCAWQQTLAPKLQNIKIAIFAADHGVCAQGVSAFPQEVTAQMVLNFVHGGAAISVLAKQLDAQFEVINIGVNTALPDSPTLVNKPIRLSTSDLSETEAMSHSELLLALSIGREHAAKTNDHLFIGGEMGIGNTTAASAIFSLLLNLAPSETVGPGTGVDANGITHKQLVVTKAIALHAPHIHNELDVLARVGGFEIAGLVGAYIGSAQRGVPVLIDGFITTAAALLACRINPSVRDWLVFAHRSAEPAHYRALQALDANPLLDLGMRLGEGSGAAIAVPIIASALNLHNHMATFDSAGVSS
ncbi:nicotinate-nucleotide--dimethylbenzimidazole phosphoribosyltransferase [Arenicella xantha]|uniref:Nicotinate-nucleotide--dimethylbenzimidazole phosphoribosyltransferase n=1 Tax=Arenicella xantha TaxID=644221 RepID=A0A395JIL1_9GAMM|nr:nicotinate-nucleotide--dimethylbenzimidazole phosphoribosyltransferase [Arenicella xantha]RBP48595.1 nicotinate-nucleotide-dimethylbenzimidazole phosphoribosyltransferase [Arenicella xantha]